MKISEDIPESIGKYKVLAQIGRGSMGVVYKALDPEIERVVAIKMLRGVFQQTNGSDQSQIGSLREEARSAGSLRHQNITTVLEFGTEGSSPYIVMDFLEGCGLDVIIKKKEEIPPEKSIFYLAQAAVGLDYAHTKGVVHCDVKPGNLLIDTETDFLYILDFGIAKFGSGPVLESAPVVGTPAYMSPEQILNEPLDGRSDVFSLGVVAFELLNGCRPYTGSDLTTVMSNILQGVRVSVYDCAPTLAERLEPVFMQALTQSRDQRYNTCVEFVQALADALYIPVFVIDGAVPRVERPQAIDAEFGHTRIRVGIDAQMVRKKGRAKPTPFDHSDEQLTTFQARAFLLGLTTVFTLCVMVIVVLVRQKVVDLSSRKSEAQPIVLNLAINPKKTEEARASLSKKSAGDLLEVVQRKEIIEGDLIPALQELKLRGVNEVNGIANTLVDHEVRGVRLQAHDIIASIPSAQSAYFLRFGLTDQSPEVRNAVVSLIGTHYFFELMPDLALLYQSLWQKLELTLNRQLMF
jgi:serine/threonine protein kinase